MNFPENNGLFSIEKVVYKLLIILYLQNIRIADNLLDGTMDYVVGAKLSVKIGERLSTPLHYREIGASKVLHRFVVNLLVHCC